jgi:hypothetical protein
MSLDSGRFPSMSTAPLCRALTGTVGKALAGALTTVLVVLMVAGCHSSTPLAPTSQAATTRPPTGTSSKVVLPPATGDYAEAIKIAIRHGLQVWLESDLVKRWQAGPGSFEAALRQLGSLAAIPGVRGIKIADEMGYHDGLSSAALIKAFLNAAYDGLQRYAPGKPLLVDMIMPSLGCLPDQQPPLLWSTECQVKADGQYPQLTLANVTSYLRMRKLAVLDVSTGLLPDSSYIGWGATRDIAQAKAWAKVKALGWASLVTLHARKALAHPGEYAKSASEAQADLHTWVDLPLSNGAQAIDVWTWRQGYQGTVNRLLDPGLKPNALWTGLQARREKGATLFTHLSPHSLEVSLDVDLAMIAKVFSAVFVAAGTG